MNRAQSSVPAAADALARAWAEPAWTAALEHLTTAVMIVGRDLVVRDLNPSAEALLEISVNQARGKHLRELPAGGGSLQELVERVLRTGEPLAERAVGIASGGGSPVMVDCIATPIDDARIPRCVLVELVDLDRHIQITRDEQLLSQGETARGLVRALAHEVKNPLGGLRGAAQLLERELSDPGLREYTRVIVQEADRLRNLVDRMLGPRSPPKLRMVNVHEVTERVFSVLAGDIPPGVHLDRDYDPSIPDVEADPESLIQCLLNIARNAVQALDGPGEVVLRTRIERQATIGQHRHRLAVRIEVVDDGPGVPDELRERIFYPLVTGRAEGIGLGLSIAQVLAQQHRGVIECASEPGHTVFSIVLPIDTCGRADVATGGAGGG